MSESMLGKKRKEKEREGEQAVRMNQWPFVCCKESWDIKDDRSQGAEQRRRQAHGFGGKLAHYLFLTHRVGKVNLVEDFSSAHTSKHRTEGQDGRGGSGGTIGRPGDEEVRGK